MKLKTAQKSYDEILKLIEIKKAEKSKKPKKPNFFFKTLLKAVSIPGLMGVGFKLNKIDMERLDKKQPCLVFMNHSSFIDLEIAASSLYPRTFNIVCTTDAFLGKNWLMRQIGCIPTQKFVTDMTLLRDIKYAINKLHSSVVLFPEAGYSFDGTATTLPDSLGSFVKMLGVPVVMIKTYGAFLRQPLYNELNKRKIKVTADMKYILSPEEVKEMSAEDINGIIAEEFSFDNFRYQQENGILINEPNRTDGLHRVLYRCPVCGAERQMRGKGIAIKCGACGTTHWLNERGFLETFGEGKPKFDHIPDWYAWERECVRREIESGEYAFSEEVDIAVLIDTKKLYRLGSGRLTHDENGFRLISDDGKLEYSQKPLASYSLNSDYYWYEIGDIICIGNREALYYCFPKDKSVSVAKVRLAAEELYKIAKSQRRTVRSKA